MRVLVVLALAAIIVYLVRGLISRRQASRSSAPPPAARPAASASEPMRQCTHCGAYFPASEAVGQAPNQLFCSEEHRRLHFQNKA